MSESLYRLLSSNGTTGGQVNITNAFSGPQPFVTGSYCHLFGEGLTPVTVQITSISSDLQFNVTKADGSGTDISAFTTALNSYIVIGDVSFIPQLPLTLDNSGFLKVTVEGASSSIGTFTQGSPNTNANGWPVKITDGTNVLGTGTFPLKIDPTGSTTQPVSALQLPSSLDGSGNFKVAQQGDLKVILDGGNVFSNQTISSNGTFPITNLASPNVYLLYDITGTAGTSLSFTIAECDPQHTSQLISGGQTASSGSITSATSGIVSLTGISSTAVLLSWTVSGSFTGSYVTVTNKFPSGSGGSSGNVNLTQIGSNNVVTGGTNGSLGVGGLGTAGSPVGGVLSIQGVSGGQAIPISGSISATNPSVSTTGTAIPADATFVGGKNGSGNLTGFSTDSSGNLNVNVISGGGSNASVGANQAVIPTSSTQIGASDGTDLQELLVESSTHPNLRVGIYSAGTEVTVTASNALKIDGSGVTQPVSIAGNVTVVQATGSNLNANVSVQASGVFSHSLNQDGSGNIGVNVENTPSVTVSGTASISGTVTSNQGTANTLANGWPVEVTDGTNILGTSSHPIRNDPTGTTTQPVSGTITANAGTGNFTVVQATASNLNANVSGTVTSNQGTSNTLANAWATKITDTTNGPVAVKPGNTAAVAADPAIVVAISPNNSITTSSGFTADRTASGNITTTQNVAINSQGTGSVSIGITGTWTGTIDFEATDDGTNWESINAVVFTTGALVTSATANGNWLVGVGALQQVRVRGNSVATGTAAITLDAGAGQQVVSLSNSLPSGFNTIGAVTGSGNFTVVQTTGSNLNADVSVQASGVFSHALNQDGSGNVGVNIENTPSVTVSGTATISGTVTANQGTANTAANSWPVEVTDGTNVLGTSSHPIRNDPTGTTIQPISGTVTANAGTGTFAENLTEIGGSAIALGQTTMAASLPVAIASNQSAIPVSESGTWTVQPGNSQNTTPWLVTSKDLLAITQSLNMTATTNAVTLALGFGQSITSVQITGGTWTGTIIFEGNIDGSNWYTLNAVVPTTGVIVTTTTSNGEWNIAVAGYASIRCRCSVAGTNSATVSIQSSSGTNLVSLTNPLPSGSNTIGAVTGSGNFTVVQATGSNLNADVSVQASGVFSHALNQDVSGNIGVNIENTPSVTVSGTATVAGTVTVNQGTANTAANSWPVEVTDGTNTLGTSSHPIRIDPVGTTTQPISGTVTANQGGAPWSDNITEIGGNSVVTGGTNGSLGIGGLQATNTALVGNPVVVAGSDYGGTAKAQNIKVDSSGFMHVTLEASTGTSVVSGTVTANAGTGSFTVAQATASNLNANVSGTVTADQGTANTLANAWTAQITDTTNGPAAVKAASTAAVATDKALVVAVSPNNSVGVTQSTSPWVEDISQIGGNTVSTAASGTIKVGIVGNAAGAMDAAGQNSASPANELIVGGQYNSAPTTITSGNVSPLQVDTEGSLYINDECRKASYSAFASFTPVAGDIAVLPGSASKTIRVSRIEVSLSTTGTAAIEAIQLIKRSAADTSGTSAAMTAVPHDSNFANASAAPLSYTAAPTPGAAVGTIRGVQFSDASSTLPGANTWLWTFGDRGASCIVLRGTAQQLCVNLGAVVATQTAVVSFEWSEE